MKVKELLDSEEKWTKGAFARDADGSKVLYHDPSATRFCLSGALKKCRKDSRAVREVLRSTLKDLGYKCTCDESTCLSCFNDSPFTTFTDIRRVLEQADV